MEQKYINSRCKNCEYWDEKNQCCGDADKFWERCARDRDYEDIENGSGYYDYTEEDEHEQYLKSIKY